MPLHAIWKSDNKQRNLIVFVFCCHAAHELRPCVCPQQGSLPNTFNMSSFGSNALATVAKWLGGTVIVQEPIQSAQITVFL